MTWCKTSFLPGGNLMLKFCRILLSALALLIGGGGLLAAETVDYLRDVKPVLVERCLRCHSSLKQEGSLQLNSVAAIFTGGDTGPAMVPGKSAESELIRRVMANADQRMPPEGEPLSDKQIALLKKWIDQGEKVLLQQKDTIQTDHWAFQRPQLPKIPKVKNTVWQANPVDAFLAADLQQHGLTPVLTAPKHILLRRVYLDLIGLPPTPQELQDFLTDDSPQALEKVVDRLLESPHYGERWGRHWMDIWRYSDWSGYKKEVRNSQPHIWRWRDWIIESLNNDKPYDRMILEMLAADEIAPDDDDALRATGYLVRNWYKFNRNVWIENTVNHTSKAFLGVTMECCKCHDHMYDPISQPEYYRFRAFFEPHNVRTDRVAGQADTSKTGLVRVYDADVKAPTYRFMRGDERKPDKSKTLAPSLPKLFGGELKIEPVSLPSTTYYPALQPFVQQEEIAKAQAAVKKAAAALQKTKTSLTENTYASAQANLVSLQARIAADKARYAKPPAQNAAQLAVNAAKAERDAALVKAETALLRAEASHAAAKVKHERTPKDAKAKKAFDAATKQLAAAKKSLQTAQANLKKPDGNYTPLGKVFPATSSGRRTALARWIASKENSLTARVAVNHIWLRHFGQPLVDNVFDFGMGGLPPRNQPLLDYLAVDLMEGGWKMKRLHRLMVTSQAYRMQSWSEPKFAANEKIDPDNRHWWRMNSRRAEAEVVRDCVLHVAGQLDTTMGGPEIDHNTGQTSRRRSVYFRHAYEKQMQFLMLFDAANVEDCYRRSESIVPQQALALTNSPLALAQSRILAGQLSKQVGSTINEKTSSAFIDTAFQRILCRRPTSQERDQCVTFLTAQAKRLADKKNLNAFTSGPAAQVKPSSDPQQRARENLVQVLMNHNDFITIR